MYGWPDMNCSPSTNHAAQVANTSAETTSGQAVSFPLVATDADVAAWVVAGAALTDKNVANDDRSATEGFHAQTLAG